MGDDLVERVLRAVELIPAGRVVSYGDLAELFDVGPRQIGAIMSRHGSGVPWWRVTSSYGDLPEHLRSAAAPRWEAEGIAWKPNGLGCRIADYRADLPHLGRQFAETGSVEPG